MIYLTPEGGRLDQAKVRQLGNEHRRLLLVSGHYEGIDERVRQGWIDEEISVGDYVLSNGTLPALTLIDALVRLIPGCWGMRILLERIRLKGRAFGRTSVYPT